MDDGEPVLGSSFPASGDAPPIAQPTVGAFNRPAFAVVRIGRLGSATAAAVDERVGVGGVGLAASSSSADHGFDGERPKICVCGLGVLCESVLEVGVEGGEAF